MCFPGDLRDTGMTLTWRGRSCQRASAFTVAAALCLAPSWSRCHPEAHRKTHSLNFRSTRDINEWPTSSNRKGECDNHGTSLLWDIMEVSLVSRNRKRTRKNEVVAGAVLRCAIDFHILQVPRLTQTRTHVWNRNRDDGRGNSSDVPTGSGRPSNFWGKSKGDVNRSWINVERWSKRWRKS